MASSSTVPSIRELKRQYKTEPGTRPDTADLGSERAAALSTGNPLYDAALTDKLVVTGTMTEAEHLDGWNWCRARLFRRDGDARGGEYPPGLLNDYKLLLALKAWGDGDEARTRTFLRALPWGWRLAFRPAVVKPAAHVFTGWRRSIAFRLVEDPRFPALQALYREILAQAPPVAVQKYRAAIQEASALLHYRFEGEREQAIHDWCYGEGKAAGALAEMEPIGTYVRARRVALREGGPGRSSAR